MRDWLDSRTGFRSLLKHLLDEPLPQGIGWWFVTGSIVLFLLTVQLLTGVLLAVFYSPSPDHAYDSVRFIMERVTFGRVLRGLISSAPASSSSPRSSTCCASSCLARTRSRAS
jgi:quinol-cytochrome oxidoreductase complex cytochrome b subunit